MSEHSYCFLAAFLGTWNAIGLLWLVIKIQKFVDDYCRSDYDKELQRTTSAKET